MKTLEHYRCPCCGKLSRGQNYGQAGTDQGHLFEVAVQHFVGGGGRGHHHTPGSGFRWDRRLVDARDLPVLRLLLNILDRVRLRLAAKIVALEFALPQMPLTTPVQTPVNTSKDSDLYDRVETPMGRRAA